VSAGLQVLDQQPLGALDGDGQPIAVAGELGVEIGQAATSWVIRSWDWRLPVGSRMHS
jgi:hypothetical protein